MPRNTSTVTRQHQIAIARRRALVLDLFAADATLTFSVAAEAVVRAGLADEKYSRQTCMRDYYAALAGLASKTDARRLREAQNFRIERLIRSVWSQAIGGDIDAIGAVVRLLDRQDKLNGLAPPKRTQLELSIYYQQLGDLAVGAVAYGMDRARLSAEQRQDVVDGIRQFLKQENTGTVIELDPVDVA
jgi:hypothetical protein